MVSVTCESKILYATQNTGNQRSEAAPEDWQSCEGVRTRTQPTVNSPEEIRAGITIAEHAIEQTPRSSSAKRSRAGEERDNSQLRFLNCNIPEGTKGKDGTATGRPEKPQRLHRRFAETTGKSTAEGITHLTRRIFKTAQLPAPNGKATGDRPSAHRFLN